MARFTLPRDIYHGKNALEALKSIKGDRAVIVTGGGSMKRHGFLDDVSHKLKDAGFEIQLIDGVEADPSVETVMNGARAMRQFEPDWIVAIGGGSAIDAAKAMWVFYEYPDISLEDILAPFSFPTLRQKARFCAIPSTSGTASEVTAFSVITDYDKGVKYPLADFNITPDMAIVDASIAMTMPRSLAANTGMDAMSHAIEAYVSTLHCDYTDPLAIQAIRLINENLIPSCDADETARQKMHDASCLAGMAFSNALLGIVHSMAHKTGAAFSSGHIPHGLANAMYLPKVISYNAKDEPTRARYAQIARAMGIDGTDDGELTDNLKKRLCEMRDSLGIPSCIAKFDSGSIGRDEFYQKLPQIARLAVSDACTLSNPRRIDDITMQRLFECCYNDLEVDF
ncbi:MAG: iron-containing alcohol dehydrogenase [Clostridia bacterium]|nr:iron-containing alcohol dehydrogenase [Clostridia bacterium]